MDEAPSIAADDRLYNQVEITPGTMVGTLLNGRYKIIQALGTGGFGQTFLAEDTLNPDQPRCVVKQLKPASQDNSFLKIARRLFQTEVDILRQLGSHDQIPTLLDDFEDDQEFYLVQEFVEGQTLSDELAEKCRLTESEVVVMLQDILQILAFVHSKQVIHRDIKPSNLIRRKKDGQFVLIDFGAVKQISTQVNVEQIQTGHTISIGTQGYVPSEQLMGKPRFNSDLYALGLTAIQALTGIHPCELPNHQDTAEVLWQDQAAVNPRLAVILNKMVRYHFSQRFQSASEVLRFLNQLDDLSVDLITAIAPTTFSPDEGDGPLPVPGNQGTWRRLTRRGIQVVTIASLTVTSLLLAVRHLLVLPPLQMAVFEPLELAVFDRMTQLQPDAGVDPRLLVVGITEADLRKYGQVPLPDRIIAQALQRLQDSQPRVIGIDLLRGTPVPPGREELQVQLKKPNVVIIMQLGQADQGVEVPAPKEVPDDRVGFNDLVVDPDNIVRRNLIIGDIQKKPVYSFALQLALTYLKAEKIEPRGFPDPSTLTLGKVTFYPLDPHSGGYQLSDTNGYQILAHYRSPRRPADQISLTELLEGNVDSSRIKDKIVLIGTTAPTGRDLFLTPYSAIERDTFKMPGVVVHAQMVSQILSAALNNQPITWYWSEPVEMLWIAGWTVVAGAIAWVIRRPLLLIVAELGLVIVLVGAGYAVFSLNGWIPVATPLLAILLVGTIVASYEFSQELGQVVKPRYERFKE